MAEWLRVLSLRQGSQLPSTMGSSHGWTAYGAIPVFLLANGQVINSDLHAIHIDLTQNVWNNLEDYSSMLMANWLPHAGTVYSELTLVYSCMSVKVFAGNYIMLGRIWIIQELHVQ